MSNDSTTTADDWEIEATEEPEEEEQETVSYHISSYPADLTLKGYLDKWDAGQLTIPDFQRAYVWDQVKASKLIESFLLGLPVPGVFLYKDRTSNKMAVIDGQQRILSAIRYFKNEFGERIFRLKKVEPRWEGKTYGELAEADQLQLDDTVLRATVVQQLDPKDDTSIYHIFERLNTGGINLNPMEIRKCVYYGDIYNLLERLNRLNPWRELLGKPKEDKRLRDVELVLRVLALWEDWRQYEKPMKGFLNSYMAKKRKLSEGEREAFIEAAEARFSETVDFVRGALGSKPFHLRGRLNYAVMDSTLSAALDLDKQEKEEFKKRFSGLLDDKEYLESATINTSDERTLTRRFAMSFKYLVG